MINILLYIDGFYLSLYLVFAIDSMFVLTTWG